MTIYFIYFLLVFTTVDILIQNNNIIIITYQINAFILKKNLKKMLHKNFLKKYSNSLYTIFVFCDPNKHIKITYCIHGILIICLYFVCPYLESCL